MKVWPLRFARVLVAAAIVAVLVVLFAGSEVVPALIAYAALAALCLPGALLLGRCRRRPDSPHLDLTPRD
jgi:hypothetical protein